VLVANDRHVGLLSEGGLKRERAALDEGDIGLEPVFLEQLLALGDIERT
jgi:hypothetical protein